jgi:hypothetical protein
LLSSKGLNKIKNATLGFVPKLFAIEEDNKINDPPSDSQETHVGTFNNQLQVNKQLDQDSNDKATDNQVNTECQSGPSNIATTREDLMAPVGGCHYTTLYPLVV